MTLAQRLQRLRLDARLTQEAIGAQGFVSAPGWVKLENGQRSSNEKLIENFLDYLVLDKFLPAKNRAPLRDELLTLKYLEAGKRSFLAELARSHAASTPAGRQMLAAFDAARNAKTTRRRGRPPGRVINR